MAADASTPLMRQYNAIKEQVAGALLLFRLGDFYELFFEDAVTAARELEITLTSRNKEKSMAIPMCGVPYHAAEGYIARLIHKGYRVAICDQMEAAGAGKKLVKREITRIVTPGTATDAHLLRSHENNYLAAVARPRARAGLAHVGISTREVPVHRLAALVDPVFADDVALGKSATLIGVLDQSASGMGGRLLRQRLMPPSLSQPETEARLDALGELLAETILRAELRKELAGVLDLERLLAKVTLGSAGPRDLLALGKSLERIPQLKRRVETRQSARLQAIRDGLDDVPEVHNAILAAIADEPPMNVTDGGAIRPGFNAELDELRNLSRNGPP